MAIYSRHLVEELRRDNLLLAKSFGDIDKSSSNVYIFFTNQYVPLLITELDNRNS
jgi:hypothetical protein